MPAITANIPIPDQCELIQGLIVQKHVILTAEDGVARLQEVVAFNAASDKLTASLKTFVAANGPISLPDGLQAAFRTSDGSDTIADIPGAYEALGTRLRAGECGRQEDQGLPRRSSSGWPVVAQAGRTQFGISKTKADEENAE